MGINQETAKDTVLDLVQDIENIWNDNFKKYETQNIKGMELFLKSARNYKTNGEAAYEAASQIRNHAINKTNLAGELGTNWEHYLIIKEKADELINAIIPYLT